MTLTPAYGRDYKSKKEIEADLAADRDFIETFSGRYINRPQLLELGETMVNVRYSQNRKVTIVKVKP